MDPYLAQVIIFAGNFAPVQWQLCNGQLLSIAQNTALFSLLGTTFGGDGQTTFALPDFRGRIPVGTGTGPGLPSVVLGQVGGSSNLTLTTSQIPAHNHVAAAEVKASSVNGATNNPINNVYGATNDNFYAASSTVGGNLGGVTASSTNTGGNQAIDKHMPSLGLNFIICDIGIFPSRN